MLATSPAAVKFDVHATPEQQACSRAIDQSLNAFWLLVERLHAASGEQQPIHQVEEMIFRDLLAMGHSLLRAFVASAGDGDVGPSLTLPGDSPSEPECTLPRREAPRARPYLSIFGELVIERVSYGEGPIDRRRWTPACTCRGGNTPTCCSDGWGPSWSTTPTPRPSRSSGPSWG